MSSFAALSDHPDSESAGQSSAANTQTVEFVELDGQVRQLPASAPAAMHLSGAAHDARRALARQALRGVALPALTRVRLPTCA